MPREIDITTEYRTTISGGYPITIDKGENFIKLKGNVESIRITPEDLDTFKTMFQATGVL